MKGICTNCGKEFETLTLRHTCSTACAIARQRESVRQMREGSGEIYERWKMRMEAGLKWSKERGSKKERG